MATVRVWDIAVRIFHWSLVAAFITSYLSGEENEFVHVNSGYIVAALVAFRVLWGLIGTRHARFGDFLYSPAKIWSYARAFAAGSPPRYLGHNPLGGLMVIALLGSLAMTCLSGMKLYAVEEGKGPLAATTSLQLIPAAHADDDGEHDEEQEGDEFWEEAHELFVNLTLGLVFLHIGGVVVGSIVHREKLVKAMITGDKDSDR